MPLVRALPDQSRPKAIPGAKPPKFEKLAAGEAEPRLTSERQSRNTENGDDAKAATMPSGDDAKAAAMPSGDDAKAATMPSGGPGVRSGRRKTAEG